MNILFISFDADPPYMGGTATVAKILAEAFISRGHFCALGFMDKSEHPSLFFKDKIKLVSENRSEVERFLLKHNFDIVLNQLPTSVDYSFLMSLPLGNCKIISAYHNRPMLRPLLLENILRIYVDSSNYIYKLYTLLKIPLLPLINLQSRKQLLKKFDEICEYSSRILLLSEKFYPVWMKLAPRTEVSKLVAIGNPLVFKDSFPLDKLEKKETTVIAVCSINSQKRVHLMLNLWKLIEKDPELDQWQFIFVGGGDGFNDLKQTALDLKLGRINFVGFQDPYSYYEKSSISIMTSKYEGWPMVLMEGQQMGVVPIAFNSFESITDIIKDGENGIIIPNNDMKCFLKNMKMLMLDSDMRQRMSKNAIVSSKKFSIDKVTEQYLTLFSNELNKVIK